ncbi:hypothetical protein [Cellulosilyticum lentocellum]|uniref:Uncharacterized protein n=1 Tax=Cellulosilyticum lentocellum (strain ATCC 49066 / DSM 5427 / NCIMB 11756 / RHM5) TaxID=642492 RepID=F2JIR4_CELLD|nr:hypothetical protein [Cellulosilyticum lentocellum]ADZ81986.1 hypothetical protein Clole_0234 [Cellulosilyticum lentocellum DSM 5427]
MKWQDVNMIDYILEVMKNLNRQQVQGKILKVHIISKLGEVVYQTTKFIAIGEEHEKLSVGEFISIGFAGVFLIIAT